MSFSEMKAFGCNFSFGVLALGFNPDLCLVKSLCDEHVWVSTLAFHGFGIFLYYRIDSAFPIEYSGVAYNLYTPHVQVRLNSICGVDARNHTYGIDRLYSIQSCLCINSYTNHILCDKTCVFY